MLIDYRLTTLPIEVGIPVKGMHLIKTSAIEWQAWLYLDVLHKRELGQIVLLRTFFQSFQKRLALGIIKLRPLPLLSVDERMNPVYEYVTFLTKAGYLTETTGGELQTHKKNSQPPYHG